MSEERRGRQNLDLTTSTKHAHSSESVWHNKKSSIVEPFQNRWVRISLKAQGRSTVFGNLQTHVNADSLKEAFNALDGKKALGVDNISKAEYGKNLDDNLKGLAERVQKGTYRPKPKKEILIPKANGKTRPIAIACFEDKLVDWVVSKILTAVFEPEFIRNSFGYRPGKSAAGAIEATYYTLYKGKRQHVVEIDFSNFFNTIPHRKLMKVIGEKISDRRFKGLFGRFLKGELVTSEGETLPSQIGTPQGSIMSPILANVYLNEVIDQWFLTEYGSYNNIIVRYADDALFFFHKKEKAEQFLKELEDRVKQFDLQLNEEKTHAITLTKQNHKHFSFLGFTFYWGKQGSRTVFKVKTQKEKLIKSIQEFEQWIKEIRNQKKLKDIWSLARTKIQGHINYFGYRMNAPKLNHFYYETIKSLFKWLNRRSQKRSYSWEGFCERLKHFPLMTSWNEMKLKNLGWNPYV